MITSLPVWVQLARKSWFLLCTTEDRPSFFRMAKAHQQLTRQIRRRMTFTKLVSGSHGQSSLVLWPQFLPLFCWRLWFTTKIFNAKPTCWLFYLSLRTCRSAAFIYGLFRPHLVPTKKHCGLPRSHQSSQSNQNKTVSCWVGITEKLPGMYR